MNQHSCPVFPGAAGRFAGLVLALALAILTPLAPASEASILATGTPAADLDIDTAPVEIDGVVLLRVRGASSLAAGTRARNIARRIEDAAADPTVAPDAVRSVGGGEQTSIFAGDRLLMIVTDADARLEQMDRGELARLHVDRIRRAIVEFRQARTPQALRAGVAYAAVATVLVVIGFAVLLWGARRIDRIVEQRVHTRIRSLAVQSFEFVRAERIGAALRAALRGLKILAALVAGLVYADFVLAQFPWTLPLSRRLLDLALDPLATIARAVTTRIPDLIFLTVLFLVFRFLLRMVRLFFDAVGRGAVTLPKFDRDWAVPTYRLLRFGIVAFALVVAYPYIPGSQSDAFKGISLFLGVLLSIGSSSAIANIIAGYMMTYRRAFKVGDRVGIGEAVGDVTELRLQVTHLRSLKNEEITIPNSQILNAPVVNYSALARSKGLILHTQVGIGYETPWRQVEAMLLIAAERTPGLLKDPPPFVHEHELGDFAVQYELNVYCADAHEMIHHYSELHRNILDVFNEHGVQIMTPAYEGDPRQPKVVARKDWFAAPAVAPEAPREAGG
ncbi:mechanosensitive ion channel domain-containing protein [Accumulibacter sp.]|uniref:mechanosensitive ion channel domain-containing protein n=1 Tax=Accumulibacter sp. TaxID=2053492 RepID=UPI0025F30217|nr:mechanosensitive ion channel domain-containing protein [Accumulibacter sp.]MCM8597018.1 mechanosensitive ion channel [Accumulibacter sp.]MCM8626236.1 mechanosensitive ion channel [Accumulibacter sp.]MDS4051167.1 mechanosensitive ion channel [Accumulibacter sp.]